MARFCGSSGGRPRGFLMIDASVAGGCTRCFLDADEAEVRDLRSRCRFRSCASRPCALELPLLLDSLLLPGLLLVSRLPFLLLLERRSSLLLPSFGL